ncbi:MULTISPECIES: T9SS type A sorting domain-containing protein [Niastella]|uniref:T9SS type A sorting domain-containing protein n=1 Tax=Niastella soli TaxID=2821487 RepID=A0ABS3YQX2_9BACT|nr:T9SS type A sorting domain-containing protein [Niastella soli]MBO9200309.1 T9SS type A sorting domain-containing protein [Niastella soli]
MVKFYFNLKKKAWRSAVITVMVLLMLPVFTLAQGLEFKDGKKVSGREGEDGAVYKFPNVTKDVDGYIRINGRSSAGVKLTAIDLESTGWDKAFQPQIEYKNKSAHGSEKDWWMEFEVSFVSSKDNTPVAISSMDLTAIDIDGDGDNIYEWISLYGLDSYTTERRTSLQVLDILENILSVLTLTGKKFSGPLTQYNNIDTTATNVMATARFTNKSKFNIRAGGHSSDNDISTERMYAFWFKSFNYTAPVQGSLPVLLNSFTAKKTGNQVVLNWSTDMERDFSHFIVEKSANGKDYSDAGVLFTDGNSNSRREYSFKDDLKNSPSGLVYYRLKMVDLDGHYQQSDVRIIRLTEDKTAQNITVYPNPVVNDLRITLASGWQDKAVFIQVVNANGQSVMQISKSRASQTESISVNDLKPGLYTVRVLNGLESAQQRFIKAK